MTPGLSLPHWAHRSLPPTPHTWAPSSHQLAASQGSRKAGKVLGRPGQGFCADGGRAVPGVGVGRRVEPGATVSPSHRLQQNRSLTRISHPFSLFIALLLEVSLRLRGEWEPSLSLGHLVTMGRCQGAPQSPSKHHSHTRRLPMCPKSHVWLPSHPPRWEAPALLGRPTPWLAAEAPGMEFPAGGFSTTHPAQTEQGSWGFHVGRDSGWGAQRAPPHPQGRVSPLWALGSACHQLGQPPPRVRKAQVTQQTQAKLWLPLALGKRVL